jgi:hypothetical protein
MPDKYESNPEPQLRQLTPDEIDVVSAGIIGGCVDVNYHFLGITYQLDGNGKLCSVNGQPVNPPPK